MPSTRRDIEESDARAGAWLTADDVSYLRGIANAVNMLGGEHGDRIIETLAAAAARTVPTDGEHRLAALIFPPIPLRRMTALTGGFHEAATVGLGNEDTGIPVWEPRDG